MSLDPLENKMQELRNILRDQGQLTSNDKARAEEMLDQVQRICRKYDAIIIHKPDCFVVGFSQGPSRPHRAVAQVKMIAPTMYDWRPIE